MTASANPEGFARGSEAFGSESKPADAVEVVAVIVERCLGRDQVVGEKDEAAVLHDRQAAFVDEAGRLRVSK